MANPENATIYYLPTPTELTPEQREHWEDQLEIAERKLEYAMRMLGRLGVERGLSEID
jgi:hypothetical protein